MILKYSEIQILYDFYSSLTGDFNFCQSPFLIRYLYFYTSVAFIHHCVQYTKSVFMESLWITVTCSLLGGMKHLRVWNILQANILYHDHKQHTVLRIVFNGSIQKLDFLQCVSHPCRLLFPHCSQTCKLFCLRCWVDASKRHNNSTVVSMIFDYQHQDI